MTEQTAAQITSDLWGRRWRSNLCRVDLSEIKRSVADKQFFLSVSSRPVLTIEEVP